MKKVGSQRIYVHLDTISNALTSKGITMDDFEKNMSLYPENILLLDPQAVEGEYERHTGLKIIRGEKDIKRYFMLQKEQSHRLVKWIDYKDISLVTQLTPMEIAELLYFGHMGTQLHSPYFYKLQNNYVYFEKPNHVSKIYYRHLDDFYYILEQKLIKQVTEKRQERRLFFKKPKTINRMPTDLLKDMKRILQEGVVFDFSQPEFYQGKYKIPIYVVEDQVQLVDYQRFEKDDQIGMLEYDDRDGCWILTEEEWESLSSLKQA